MSNFFPSEVVGELGSYVYRLIDPRNGETFYVGKGKGNRVFAHAAGDLEDGKEDGLTEKLRRIREIKLDGFEVQHLIHRHGMDDKTAFEVEGALMEAYATNTNIAGGHGNADRGVAHSKQIIERYTAEPADLSDPIIEITINHTGKEATVYNATRFAWRLALKRAQKAQFAVAVTQGLIVGVFEIDEWLEATTENFPEFSLLEDIPGRFGFRGREAPQDITEKYYRKKVPPKAKGAANPIRYHNI